MSASSPAQPTSATASPSASTEEQVLAVYRAFDAYRQEVGRTGEEDTGRLAELAIGEAYQKQLAETSREKTDGFRFQGKKTGTPSVVRVDLSATPALAELKDCIDVSDWSPVAISTAQVSKAPGSSSRVPATAEAQRMPDGSWRISRLSARPMESC